MCFADIASMHWDFFKVREQHRYLNSEALFQYFSGNWPTGTAGSCPLCLWPHRLSKPTWEVGGALPHLWGHSQAKRTRMRISLTDFPTSQIRMARGCQEWELQPSVGFQSIPWNHGSSVRAARQELTVWVRGLCSHESKMGPSFARWWRISPRAAPR